MNKAITDLTDQEIFERFRFAVQKARSNLMELGDDIAGFAQNTHPWLFGDQAVTRAIEIYDRSELTTIGIPNLLIIADHEPLIGIGAVFYGEIPTPEQYIAMRMPR